MRIKHIHKIAFGATVLIALGCKKNNEYTAGGEAYTGASAGASSAALDTAAPSTPMLTDPNIVFILDEANASDSARGKLASTKGSDAEVRQFGKIMMGEHHMLREAGKKLAKSDGVTPEAPTGDETQTKSQAGLADLNATPKGPAWDKAYIDYEVSFHQQVLETAGKAKDMTQNAELKKLIEDAAPIIQKHLDMAKQIQTKLGASGT
jgi:putative membrane protein